MPSLVDLPNEILLSIFSHLGNQPFDRHELRSLCRTHKALRPLAEKLLYSHLYLNQYNNPGKFLRKITCFLTSLHRRPELAGFVQTIKVIGFDRWQRLPWVLNYGCIRDAVEQVKRLQFPNPVDWTNGLMCGHTDALLAYLLFSVRQSLRELTTDVDFIQCSDQVAKML